MFCVRLGNELYKGFLGWKEQYRIPATVVKDGSWVCSLCKAGQKKPQDDHVRDSQSLVAMETGHCSDGSF